MRTGVDSLLDRIAEFAPVEVEESEAAAALRSGTKSSSRKLRAAPTAASPRKLASSRDARAAAAKSVRIALARLDRMMNTVGELVINRTRMVGRVAELEKLGRHAELLERTSARQSRRVPGKVRIQSHQFVARPARALDRAPTPQMLTSAAAGDTSFWSDFSELEMDRYDDFNILSRSMAEISADVNEVLSQLEGFIGRVEGDIDEFTKLAHHLQDEITAARMVPIGTLYSRLSRAVRDAAKSAGKQVELDLSGSETELDNNIIQQISDPLVHLVRNSVAHGIEAARGSQRRGQAGTRSSVILARLSSRQSHLHRSRRRRPRHRLRTRQAERHRTRSRLPGNRRIA